MIRPVFLRVALLLCFAQATACVTVTTPSFMRSAPEREWGPTLERARTIAASGNVAQADSLLASFAATYPGTAGARESNYWRPILQLQASNPSLPLSTTAQMLTAYAATADADRPAEARILRDAVLHVDSLTRASTTMSSKVQTSNGEVANANARAADAKADVKAATADNKDQDAEIKRLRDELAKSKEELDRIKKRLAEPTTKKPPV